MGGVPQGSIVGQPYTLYQCWQRQVDDWWHCLPLAYLWIIKKFAMNAKKVNII